MLQCAVDSDLSILRVVCLHQGRLRRYGVATISKLLKSYRSLLQKSPVKETIFCKETHNFKDPTNRSHLIRL